MVDVPTMTELTTATTTIDNRLIDLEARIITLENQLTAFKLALKALNEQFNPT